MALTKRVQVLMEPEEFEALERIARQRQASVGDLMREAVRVQHLSAVDAGRRSAAAARFLALPEVELPAWTELEKEIEGRRGPRLP